MGQEQSNFGKICTHQSGVNSVIEKAKMLPELHTICRRYETKSTWFEYDPAVDISSLKPFFDARIAVALFDGYEDNGIAHRQYKHSYTIRFNELVNLCRSDNRYKITIVVYGDDDMLKEVKNITNKVDQKIKQRIKDDLDQLKAKVLNVDPPKYEEPTYVPSAPAKEI